MPSMSRKSSNGLLRQRRTLMQVNLLLADCQGLEFDIERRGDFAQRFLWPSPWSVDIGKLRQREDPLLLVLGGHLGRHLVQQVEAVDLLRFGVTMIAEFARLALLAHDKGRRLRWKLSCPFAQPIDGLGNARIQRIELHTLGFARERHDHAERWSDGGFS